MASREYRFRSHRDSILQQRSPLAVDNGTPAFSEQRDLEMNHSHYLMVDDGTVGNRDLHSFRTKLCVQVAGLQNETAFASEFDRCLETNEVNTLL